MTTNCKSVNGFFGKLLAAAMIAFLLGCSPASRPSPAAVQIMDLRVELNEMSHRPAKLRSDHKHLLNTCEPLAEVVRIVMDANAERLELWESQIRRNDTFAVALAELQIAVRQQSARRP